jgi:hypothetical protein
MEHEIDGWIEQLSQCKQLPEPDVKKLCDKVDNSRHQGLLPCSLLDLMIFSPVDARDLDGGVQCATCEMSCHRLR